MRAFAAIVVPRSTKSQRPAMLRSMGTRAAAMRLDTVADVDSPEQVRFQYRIAGPARRGLAYLIDLLIKAIVIVTLALLITMGGFSFFRELGGFTFGLFAITLFVLDWGYYVVFETLWSGRSPGKRALRLRVVKEGGYPIDLMDALLRNLLRAADFLPSFYAMGAIVMVIDPRFRRLGDLVAGTMVVVEERVRVTTAVKLEPPPTPAELAAIGSAISLRADERQALDAFVRRMHRIGPARADELAELALPVFADRLPPDAEQRPARWLAVLYVKAIERRRNPA